MVSVATPQAVDRLLRRALELSEGARLSVRDQPLRGGLEASAIRRITVRFGGETRRRRVLRLVLKQLDARAAREARIYRDVVNVLPGELAPRVYAIEQLGPSSWLLLLECVRSAEGAWPWRDTTRAEATLRRLAALHQAPPSFSRVPAWNYEAELESSADETLQALEQLSRDPWLGLRLKRGLPATRRLVSSLRPLRAELLRFPLLGATLVHGDVHPGNVLLERRGASTCPVFIDWGRARVGSPLEDVSSWLHSLGYWEPEARRRHDTLLTGYLAERGLSARLPSDVRAAHWVAGASNALAGALRYHLYVAESATSRDERAAAARAALDWLRILRRADAYVS